MNTLEKENKKDTALSAASVLFSLLPGDVGKGIKVGKDTSRKILKEMTKMRGGLASKLAMHCQGADCQYSSSCPLVADGVVDQILGLPCPFEENLILVWREEYVKALDINPENKIEMDRVNELIETDIIDMRTSGMLAAGELFDFQPVGFDRQGNPVVRKEMSVAIQAKMKFKERKDRIIKEFMATREMRNKYKMSQNVDPSTYSANLLQQAGKFSRPIEDAEFEQVEAQEENTL